MDQRLRPFLARPVAHRGLHDGNHKVPENSMLAFERAIKAGHPIECDVRLTSDGEVVVFHDQSLSRLCQSDLLLEETPLAALSRFRLAQTKESIPTLTQLLELVDGKVPILLELKVPKFNGALERVVKKLVQGSEDWIAIQSFHPISMWWWKENAPSFLRGMISGDMRETKLPLWKRLMIENLMFSPVVKPHFYTYEGRELSRQVLSLTNLPIFAWTARSQLDHDRYLMNGASNIIFEGYNPLS